MVAPTGPGDAHQAIGRAVTFVQYHSKRRNISLYRRPPKTELDRNELDFQQGTSLVEAIV